VNAHIEAREGIIAGVDALGDLVAGSGTLLFVVSQGIDVSSQTRRGRSIYTSDMVVDANVPTRVVAVLLEEVDQVRRPELAQGDEGLGTGFNGFVEDVFRDPKALVSLEVSYSDGRVTYSGTAGAGIVRFAGSG
jgi:hypothetical protein